MSWGKILIFFCFYFSMIYLFLFIRFFMDVKGMRIMKFGKTGISKLVFWYIPENSGIFLKILVFSRKRWYFSATHPLEQIFFFTSVSGCSARTHPLVEHIRSSNTSA